MVVPEHGVAVGPEQAAEHARLGLLRIPRGAIEGEVLRPFPGDQGVLQQGSHDDLLTRPGRG